MSACRLQVAGPPEDQSTRATKRAQVDQNVNSSDGFGECGL